MKTIHDFLLKIKNKTIDNCKICNGTGWIDSKKCKCLENFEVFVKYKNAGIDPEYWNVSFSDWKRDSVSINIIKSYITKLEKMYENGYGLILIGPHGVGKTMSISLILKEAVKKNYKVLNVSFCEFLDSLNNFTDEKFDHWKYIDFFSIDNVSNYKFSPKEKIVVDDFFRSRVRLELPFFITSNLNKDELAELLGPGIMSILASKCKLIPIMGEDYRQEVLAKKIKI